jgi:hypothetical protein
MHVHVHGCMLRCYVERAPELEAVLLDNGEMLDSSKLERAPADNAVVLVLSIWR